jgi:hypothetical protein
MPAPPEDFKKQKVHPPSCGIFGVPIFSIDFLIQSSKRLRVHADWYELESKQKALVLSKHSSQDIRNQRIFEFTQKQNQLRFGDICLI